MTETLAQPETYFPSRAMPANKVLASPGLIIVYGRAGSGKSHGGYQLLRDARFGPSEVLFAMVENALATYNPPEPAKTQVVPCSGVRDVYDLAIDLGKAAKAGKRIPKVVFVDSINGATDKEQERYDAQQTGALTGESLLTNKGERDTWSEFGDMGKSVIRTLIRLREVVPAFVIVNVTTHEPKGEGAEIAVDGKMIPKHLTRESNVALHIKAQRLAFDAAKGPGGYEKMPHVVLGKGVATGEYDGTGIARFYQTQDDGEVFAKGHHALNLIERAYLPDILAKISGQKPLY